MIIRPHQLRGFEVNAAERFELRALQHLRQQLPDQVRHLSDEQVRAAIRDAIPRANSFDLKTERQIICFLDAEALLGARFYEAGEHGWAAQLLASAKLHAQDKAGVLLATACSVYQDTRGSGRVR